MTRAQEVIRKYIYINFYQGSVQIIPIGKDKIRVTDAEGESMTLTMNLFGDIMNADTREVYAISDLPHDMDQIGLQLPKSWREVDRV